MTQLQQKCISFIGSSPTPFHAVEEMAARLTDHGFLVLREEDAWTLKPGGKYFVTRNDSSIIAFVMGQRPVLETGFRLVGAHTDSPCFKVRPNPDVCKQGYTQLGVEVYGGVLLNPWFDRDLSIAGRVSYVAANGEVRHVLIDFKRPIAVIPSLAIHLDREANKNRSVNPQTDCLPIILQSGADDKPEEQRFVSLLEAQIRDQYPNADVDQILAFECLLYDTQLPALTGFHESFLSGARLDNLLSCFIGLESLLAAKSTGTSILVCNDHEEIGSASMAGADGPFLESVLNRIEPDREACARALSRSFMVSADNAHGVHPNFAAKHDDNHGPLLNAGPVIKINANHRYATNSVGESLFRQLCIEHDVPVQVFTVRADMGCGSTIGPISAAKLGIQVIDVGVPTFAMHSIREMAGSQDCEYLHTVLKAFFR